MTSPKYLPLQIGNVWVYDHYKLQYNFHERIKIKVTGDTIAFGHKYYKTSETIPFIHVTYYVSDLRLFRVDSTNGNILAYKYSSGCSYKPNDIVIDSLAAKLNNTNFSCPFFISRKCIDTGYFTIFNQSFKHKQFSYTTGSSQSPTGYLYNIGLLGSAIGSIGQEGYNLLGCVINGVVYGDTNLVGINQISTEVPKDFSLSQNYPNPFNPSTKIKFAVSFSPLGGPDISAPGRGNGGNVKLIVYDVLGKEIEVLVNEKLTPGTYEVQWNAGGFPSGIYFYSIFAENYTETKKMALVK